ncbi:PREDICTED: endoplasmic reticulum metallopeptidase 1 [Ficedula albicollis]|uniref:endoplasmic reticulum metallopeptidase 1 n=1 Tax=Ficedula albicollis TaxID=59894 RepID=UPI00035A1642|nr:PREDICTED: endoplasmic reticulum metallopeptidase 1 [Ficedula albicollis]
MLTLELWLDRGPRPSPLPGHHFPQATAAEGSQPHVQPDRPSCTGCAQLGAPEDERDKELPEHLQREKQREAVESPPLGISKNSTDKSRATRSGMTLLGQGGWTRFRPAVPRPGESAGQAGPRPGPRRAHGSHRQLLSRPPAADGPRDFSAARARGYLDNITAIGPRTVGSPENEVLAVNYLLEQIRGIERESTDAHKISVDIQRPTGSFSIDFLGGFTSYYANITNVVVKLEPRDGAEHAVLSNCHFDSVPNTPGASDDAVSCAVMLEILNTLSKSSEALQHAVIFLFNGAEENILQASHGFITQHEWAKSIRAFINLEAAGVGGKELVFQTGPENPWLVQAYVVAAKHPFASVVAQEIFQSGIIPADTDFRIYRDFGNVPGIDLAFIENGYIYHTEYDTSDRILTDSIQRAGDNILAVLKYLATSEKLAKSFEYRHGNVVFFDILGLFVLAYPARVGTIMNYITAAVAFFYLSKKVLQPKPRAINNLKKLLTAFGITLTSWVCTLVAVLMVAMFVSIIGRALSWYTHFYVSVSLYGTAAAAKLILVHMLAKKFFYKNVNEQYLGDVFFDASLMIWSIALAVMTQMGLCSAFICTLWVAFPLLTKLMIHKEFSQKGATIKFIVMYMLGMFVPYLYMLYLSWTVFEMFTPVMGRSGSEIPPDMVLAGFIVIFTMILSSYFINFIYLVKSTKTTLVTLTTVFVVTLILVCSGIFFPYSSDAANPKPKRVFLQHTSRRFHDLDGNVVKSDSGIWINGFDYNGISHITPHVPEINDTIRTPCEEQAPFCGLPWILPVHFMFRKNWYLPAPEILPRSPIQFKLLSKQQMPWNSVRLSFEVSGPSHMSLYVRPRAGSALSRWSLGDGAPVASLGGDYFVFYSRGLQAAPWHFWVELTAPEKHSDGIVSLAIAAHYFFGEDQKSPQLYALLERFPNWTFSSGWSCTYDLFVF